MRIPALLSAALIASSALGMATTASAADVSVAIGPDLQKKADDYGTRELDYLSKSLTRSVERALTRNGALVSPDSAIKLVIEDAKPNRPTMQQMSNKPGLSMDSFGIGGARVTGTVTSPTGSVTPVSFSWYETDIRNSLPSTTWSDAQTSFDRFAYRLAKGESVAER